MAQPQWFLDFSALLRRSGPVSKAEGLAVLKSARSLAPALRTPWNSVGFVWLEYLSIAQSLRATAPQSRSLEALDWLLESKLPVHGAFFSSHGLEKHSKRNAEIAAHNLVRANPAKNQQVAALYQGLPERPSAECLTSPWLARTFWAGRHHPDLPSIIARWVAGGADPDFRFADPSSPDQPKGHSSWAAALASGRLDALQALVNQAPNCSPPDWSWSVGKALRWVTEGNIRSTDRAAVMNAVRWFADRFPPLPEEAQRVTKWLAAAHPAALWAWLSVPQAGLARGAPLLGVPEGFNPWSLLPHAVPGLEADTRAVFQALTEHPVYGHPDIVRGTLVKESNNCRTPLLDFCLLPDQVEEAPDWRAPFLFLSLATDWGLEPSGGFVERLAGMRTPPDHLSTAWLSQHRAAWTGQTPGTRSPWHVGVRRPSAIQWLVEQGVGGHGVDAAGNTGWANALAHALRQEGDNGLIALLPLLQKQGLTGAERGLGLPVSAWVASREPGVVDLEVAPATLFEVGMARLMVAQSNRTANLFQSPDWDWAALSGEQKHRLLEAWACSSVRPEHREFVDSVKAAESFVCAGKTLLPLTGGALAKDLPFLPAGIFAKAMGRDGHLQNFSECATPSRRCSFNNRWDLKAAFAFFEGADLLALPRKDQWALARWLFVEMVTQNEKDGPGDSRVTYPWGESSAKAWEGLKPLERAGLARAMITWLAKTPISQAPLHLQPDAQFPVRVFGFIHYMLLRSNEATAVPLSLGLPEAKFPEFLKTLEKLSGPLASYGRTWSSDTRARLLGKELPASRPAPARPRF